MIESVKRSMSWLPGDPLPEWWRHPAKCPAGHAWGPGRISMSWIGSHGVARYSTACQPPLPARCAWVWIDPPTDAGIDWRRERMSADWNPHTGDTRGAPPTRVQLRVQGEWRPGRLYGWLPIEDDEWIAEVTVGDDWVPEHGRMFLHPERVHTTP